MSSSGKSEAGGLAPPEASRWVPGGGGVAGTGGVSLCVPPARGPQGGCASGGSLPLSSWGWRGERRGGNLLGYQYKAE